MARNRDGELLEPETDEIHNCDRGWLGEDHLGRPWPCPECKADLIRRQPAGGARVSLNQPEPTAEMSDSTADLLERPTSAEPLNAPIGTDESKSRDRVPREITPELGEQLRAWRERGGWSRQDIARAAGITVSYYGALERAKAAPSVIVAGRISWALGLDAAETAELQAQAVHGVGRDHPERAKREARRPPPRRAQTREQLQADLLAAIAREQPSVLDIDALARALTHQDLSDYDRPVSST